MRRYIFLLTALALHLVLTIPTIVSGKFTFAFDMGRDLLWVRNMVELKQPTLIGPWGSIAGIYFGPLWYYLLTIPYTIFRGDPRGTVTIPLTANLTSIILGWWFLRRRNHQTAANVWAILYAASPMAISLSSFAFHANLLPLTTLIFIIGLYKGPALPLSVLSASLAYHLEPAAGVMLTGFLGLWLIGPIITRKIKIDYSLIRLFAYSLILFIIPFVPQIIFELRHNFIQSKSLIAYFQGENTSLGGILPLNQRLTERVIKLSNTVSYSLLSIESSKMKLIFGAIFLILIILSSVIPARAGVYTNRFRIKPGMTSYVLRFTLYFLLFHYLAYTFLFPSELKGWYLFGLLPVFLLPASLMLERIQIQHRNLAIAIILVIAMKNISPAVRIKNIIKPPQSAPETLAAQMEVIDWIYNDYQNRLQPFSVYTYTPPIYDYTNQYLIWWQGTKKYNLLPAQYRYLPQETGYLPSQEQFISRNWSLSDARVSYLIINPPEQKHYLDGWIGHFSTWPEISAFSFTSGIKVETRSIINKL